MSAYFSINFEFDRAMITDTLVRDFYACLAENGVQFHQGTWNSEGYSLEQQILVNQDYISSDSPSFEGSYCQAMFHYLKFTEVRGYWSVKRHRTVDEVWFTLIIPEDDFYRFTRRNELIRYKDRMERVRNLCVQLWKMPSIRRIESEWECSDSELQSFDEIAPDWPPQTEPFSIIPIEKYCEEWNMKASLIERNGVLLEDEDNWHIGP